VSFAFAPNRVLVWSDVISLVACLALLVLLLVRRPRAVAVSLARLPDAHVKRWPLVPALALGFAAALVLGFVFALRAGAVLGPLVFVMLWRGVSARTLALVGGVVLLVAVPIAHFVPGLPTMGFQTNYAVKRIGEHWIAVGALCAFGAALWRTLSPARGRPPDPDS
jgi:hypothetical protein